MVGEGKKSARFFARLRERVGVYRPGELSGLAQLFSCIYCFSIWAALAVLALMRVAPSLVYLLAMSSVAIIVERITHSEASP